MAKFTYEEKIKAAKRYLEENEGCQTIAERKSPLLHKSR